MPDFPPEVENEGVVRSTHLLYDWLDESLNWSCGYAEDRADPPCMAPATWHGILLDGDTVLAAMCSCEAHRDCMAISVHYIHEMDSACMLPGSHFFWPDNVCAMPDEPVSLTVSVAETVRA